jgi:hypothetical protein
MNSRDSINPTRPLARGTCTRQASSTQAAIIAMGTRLLVFFIARMVGEEKQPLWVVLALADQQNYCRLPANLKVTGSRATHHRNPRVTGSKETPWGSNWKFQQANSMPRLRGTPRRGAAWHAAKSRRKRKQQFEAALAMATRRRKARPRTPPMAYVVEEIPEGGIPESISEHLIFTVPENWHPSSDFGQDRRPSSEGDKVHPQDGSPEAPHPPCYIEEERPSDSFQNAQQNTPTGHHEDSSGGNSQNQPPSNNWDCLSLIFEIRSLLGDQTFRLARIEQRLDMYFAAHSRTHPRRQCPTCACAYAFPDGWKMTEDQLKCDG